MVNNNDHVEALIKVLEHSWDGGGDKNLAGFLFFLALIHFSDM